MNIYQRLFTFFTAGWLVIFSFSACEKGDQLPPIIDFELPTPYTFYTVGDTILVKARVRDERQIKEVSVQHTAGGGGTSFVEVPITNSTDFTFEVELVLSDKYLSSGEYIIYLRASDGQNISSKQQKIVVAEIPLEREKLIWLCQSGQTLQTYSFPWSSSPQLIQSFTGDYSGSAVSSRYGQLYVSGRIQGSYSALDLYTNQLLWEIPANNSTPFPYFNGLTFGARRSYVSYFEGFIRGYDEFGAQKFNGLVPEEYTARKMMESNNRLFAYLEDKIPIAKKMAVYHGSTGTLIQEVTVGGAIVEILPRTSHDVLVFWNEGGQGQLRIYDFTQNAFYQPRSLPPGKIISACQLSNDTYALAMSTGIQFYRYSTNSITPLVDGVQAQALVYEEIGNEIIAAIGKEVRAFNAQTGLPLYFFAAPDSVLAVHLLYNK